MSKKVLPKTPGSKKEIANEFADNLRKRLTKSEKHFKEMLVKLKIRHTTQKIIYKEKSFYIADFYIPEKRLCIEIDGGYHLDSKQIKKDKDRDKYLNIRGYATWRMSNEESDLLTLETLTKKLSEYKTIPQSIKIIAPAEERPYWNDKKKFGNPRNRHRSRRIRQSRIPECISPESDLR